MSDNENESTGTPPPAAPEGHESAPVEPLRFRTPVYETFEKGAETSDTETKEGRRDDG